MCVSTPHAPQPLFQLGTPHDFSWPMSKPLNILLQYVCVIFWKNIPNFFTRWVLVVIALYICLYGKHFLYSILIHHYTKIGEYSASPFSFITPSMLPSMISLKLVFSHISLITKSILKLRVKFLLNWFVIIICWCITQVLYHINFILYFYLFCCSKCCCC